MRLIAILFFLFINTSFAGYVAESKINVCSRLDYPLKERCEESEGESCYKVPSDSGECGIFKIEDVVGVDLSKPIYSKNQVEECSDPEECQYKLENLLCIIQGEEAIKNLESMEVYCSRLTGYQEKVVGQQIGIDPVLKAQKDAEKAQALALENAMNAAQKAMDCGKTVQKLLLVRNSVKGLTTTQIKQMVATYSSIKQLLDTGSLVSAKEEIQAITADGVLVTEGDKTALIAEINKCL